MSAHTGPAGAEDLPARIAQLEQQLAAATQRNHARDGAEAQLRETLEFTESIVDTVREPMLVLDGTLNVTNASRSFYQVFGFEPKDTIGRFLYDLGDRQWNVPALRQLLEEVLPRDQKVTDFEVAHTFPTLGSRVMLLNACKLWRPGNHTERILLAIEDVTERKRIESQLLRSNEDLQRFAYVAAHDLRSPVHGALRMSQLLARRLQGAVAKDDSSLLAESIQNLERVAALMQDILTFSEAGHAPQQLTLVPLKEPLDAALLNINHHVEDCTAAVNVGPMPSLLVDRTQMIMVFQNLLGNALKYRRPVPLKIDVQAHQSAGFWQISISDNGQGFEPQYVEAIFEPFKRLHGPNVPGSGIGLATCRRIIDRQGGRLWAESAYGQGSTFHFTIPDKT